MRASELAQRLSDAAFVHQTAPDAESLQQLESLARAAAVHVRRVGAGSVDHIILSSMLRLIVVNVPTLRQVLTQAGWLWFEG